MNNINQKESMVYVSDYSRNKDISDAKRYGKLKSVFLNPHKPYDTDLLILTARKRLENFSINDYLLMIGDPALSAVCMSVACEVSPRVITLSWDRLDFNYRETEWNFYALHEDEANQLAM